MTRSGAAAENEGEEHKTFMNSTAKRMQKMTTTQKAGMPAMTGGSYQGPVIITHKQDKQHNNCVITNDTHSKATNQGFSRGESGRFFCH